MKDKLDRMGAIEALLGKDPCTAYLARRDLLSEAGKALEAARQASLASPLVAGLRAELGGWPGKLLSSHKSPEQCFHLLSLAVELGLRRGDPGADAIAAAVMAAPSPEGPFSLPSKISSSHGGKDEPVLAWALCDAPVTLRALFRMGYGQEVGVREAVDYLSGLAFPEEAPSKGWPCVTSASLGGWRGPGRKADPCPYATLVMVELLTEVASSAKGKAAETAKAAALRGGEALMELWERSRESHPYIFYMGEDFRKLKFPLLWYDLLHVLDVLGRIEGLQGDGRLGEMLDVLASKAGTDGLFIPESVYQRWKGADFGQKKKPSGLVSVLALRILDRAGRL